MTERPGLLFGKLVSFENLLGEAMRNLMSSLVASVVDPVDQPFL